MQTIEHLSNFADQLRYILKEKQFGHLLSLLERMDTVVAQGITSGIEDTKELARQINLAARKHEHELARRQWWTHRYDVTVASIVCGDEQLHASDQADVALAHYDTTFPTPT